MLVLMLSLTPAYAAESTSMSHFVKTAEYAGFSDVVGTEWFAADVQKACELGIMTGKSGGVFDPTGGLSLAEAITMAAKARSIYEGGGFTPGGTPWYQNAVNYATEQGIIYAGEYTDYTQPAKKADMAGMFAFVLPASEYARINRIACIPDVDAQVDYTDYIYRLYNAGILTGDGAHAFHPADGVSRAEAAAIINRVALPESRKHFTLDTPVAWGKTFTSADGSFKVNVPDGWNQGEDDTLGFYCEAPDGAASLQVYGYSKVDYPDYDPFTLAMENVAYITSTKGEDAITEDPIFTTVRGLSAMTFSYQTAPDAPIWSGFLAYTIENSENSYFIILGNYESCTDAQWAQLLDVLYSLDFAL